MNIDFVLLKSVKVESTRRGKNAMLEKKKKVGGNNNSSRPSSNATNISIHYVMPQHIFPNTVVIGFSDGCMIGMVLKVSVDGLDLLRNRRDYENFEDEDDDENDDDDDEDDNGDGGDNENSFEYEEVIENKLKKKKKKKNSHSHEDDDNIQTMDNNRIAMSFAEDSWHKGTLTSLHYYGEKSLLISGSADYSIKIWDVSVREICKPCIQMLQGHGGRITGLAVYKEHIFSSSIDGTIRIWRSIDTNTTNNNNAAVKTTLLHPFYQCNTVVNQGRESWITCLAFSNTSRIGSFECDLYVGDSQGNFYTYSPILYDRTCKLQLLEKKTKLHSLGINSIHSTLMENFVFTLGSDGYVCGCNRRTGGIFMKIQNRSGTVFTSCWLNENKELILCDHKGYISIHNIYTDKRLKRVYWPFGPLLSIQERGKSNNIKIAASLNTVDDDVEDSEAKLIGKDETEEQIKSMMVKDDWWKSTEYVIASATTIHVASILRSDFTSFEGHNEAILGLYYVKGERDISDDDAMITASVDYSVCQFELMNMKCTNKLTQEASELLCSIYFEEYRMVCTGHENGSIVIWNIETSTVTVIPNAHSNSVTSFAFGRVKNKGNRHLYSGGYDGKILVLDISLAQTKMDQCKVALISVQKEEILSICYDEVKDRLLVGSVNGNIRVLSGVSTMSNWKITATLKHHTEAVVKLILDSNFLFSASQDSMVVVWDLASYVMLRSFCCHSQAVTDMIVLPSNGMLMTCSLDGRVCVCDYACLTREPIVVFQHYEELRCMCLNTKNMNTVWAGTSSGSIFTFNLYKH